MIDLRLIIDIDRRKRKWAVRKLGLIKRAFPCHRVEFERSASGRGYHIIVYQAASSFEEMIVMREWFGDDSRRIFFDVNLQPERIANNVLFDKKYKNYVWSYGEI